MTVRDAQRAIEPGSLPQGARSELESGLSSVLAGQEQAAGGPSPAPGGGSVAIPEDPLGALLSGQVEGGSGPVTSGLSVGAGDGPAAAPDVMLGSRAEKLRQLAQEASSPQLRAAARNELRRMAREGI